MIWKNIKMLYPLAIFKEITKTHAANFTLKYIRDRIQTLIQNRKVVNETTGAGLGSFYLKRDDKPIFETIIFESSFLTNKYARLHPCNTKFKECRL